MTTTKQLTPEQQYLLTHITEMSEPAQAAAWQFLVALYSLDGELKGREEFINKLYSEDALLEKEWGEFIKSTALKLEPLRLWMDELGYHDQMRKAA